VPQKTLIPRQECEEGGGLHAKDRRCAARARKERKGSGVTGKRIGVKRTGRENV